jgi:histidinol dehydrogenase
MDIYYYDELTEKKYETLKNRSSSSIICDEVFNDVKKIAADVKKKGNKAVLEYTEKFDKVFLNEEDLFVSIEEFKEAENRVNDEMKSVMTRAIESSKKYNQSIQPANMETYTIGEGVLVGRKYDALESVAIYVPSGKGSYPSSFITTVVPAIVAGVKNITVIVPPNQDGSVDAALLVVANMLGVDRVFRANGVAAIFAAAFGTETFKKVQMVVGPGSEYIMAAQLFVQMQGTKVPMFFGPSECMIIADESADSELVAADLINEAEHGMHSSAILLTDSLCLAEKVKECVKNQLQNIPEWRRRFAQSASEIYGGIVIVQSINQAIDVANEWGNEHIQIATKDAWEVAKKIKSASEILVGQNTTFSAISYAIGVPACLPTGQFSRLYGGVTVDTFLKPSAITQLSDIGLAGLKDVIKVMSEYEGFPAHTKSILIREEKGII